MSLQMSAWHCRVSVEIVVTFLHGGIPILLVGVRAGWLDHGASIALLGVCGSHEGTQSREMEGGDRCASLALRFVHQFHALAHLFASK
jgi:hypothetical protein